jgi:hypothetical protein
MFFFVYITNKFQTTFAQGGEVGAGVGAWGENPLIKVTVNSKEENS